MAQLKNGTSIGGYLAYHSGNFTTSTYVSTTYNTSLNTDSRNSRGVTRLYRSDDNSDYSVQVSWTGSHWLLQGYSLDTYNAGCKVTLADTIVSQANSATITATSSNTGNQIVLRDSNGDFSARYGSFTYLNSTDDVNTGSISYIMAKFGDNYMRSASAAKVAAFLAGNGLIVGTGIAKITVGTSTPSGPTTGDLWVDTN